MDGDSGFYGNKNQFVVEVMTFHHCNLSVKILFISRQRLSYSSDFLAYQSDMHRLTSMGVIRGLEFCNKLIINPE